MEIKKKILIWIISLCMILACMMPLTSAADNNVFTVIANEDHVTVGDTFYTVIHTDVNWEIDTASILNLTFLPAGVVNYTSTAQGDLFGDQLVFYYPEDGNAWDEINNASGYAKQITWVHTVAVNNTNSSLVNITWLAYDVGTAVIGSTNYHTYYDSVDNGTEFNNETIYVHPYRPMQTNVAATNETILNLRWNPDWGSYGDTDQVLIMYNTSGSPSTSDHTDGLQAYNGTGDYATATLQQYNHTGLASGTTYYYVFWAYNTTYNMYSLLGTADSGSTTDTNNPPVIGSPVTGNGTTI